MKQLLCMFLQIPIYILSRILRELCSFWIKSQCYEQIHFLNQIIMRLVIIYIHEVANCLGLTTRVPLIGDSGTYWHSSSILISRYLWTDVDRWQSFGPVWMRENLGWIIVLKSMNTRKGFFKNPTHSVTFYGFHLVCACTIMTAWLTTA